SIRRRDAIRVLPALIVGATLARPRLARAQPASAGGPFRLISADGRSVTESSFPGQWLIVYFGYTSCPDACPTALMEISQALERLGPAAAVQPLFITLDPRRDTAQVLKDYMAAFDPRILALTGAPEQIADVARVYRVTFERQDTD